MAGSFIFAIQSACAGSQGTVELRADFEAASLRNHEIVALPYDPERILDSLERASSEPRPQFPELEAELMGFRRSNPDSITEFRADWIDTREEVARLADSLNEIGRAAPGYAAAYARFRAAYTILARTEAGLEREMRNELAEDRELARRAAAAADSVRRWERKAYRDFGHLTDAFDEVLVRTDSTGKARVELSPGRWWIVARAADRENPFLEYSWNIPIVVSAVVPVVVPVSSRNVTLRWRR